MRKLVLLISIAVCFQAQSQTWLAVEGGFDQGVQSSTVIGDNLILTGTFSHTLNGTMLNGIAVWNGSTISSFTDQVPEDNWVGGVGSVVEFDGKLYFNSSTFEGVEGYEVDKLFCWDGDSLYSEFLPLYHPQSIINYQEQLVVSQVGTSHATASIYMWDGLELDSASYNGYTEDEVSFSLILALQEFDGELYLGGNIHSDTTYKELIKWDGEIFGDLQGGILGSSALVMDLELYDNDLIVAGLFWQVDGNASNCIMKWDGESFTPLGLLGANNRVDCLMTHEGLLYAGGLFTQMDGQDCRIAVWDGEVWSCFSNDDFAFNGISQGGWLRTMTIFQNELYVGGVFHNINDQPLYHIAQFDGNLPVNIKDEENEPGRIKVFPNPAIDEVWVSNLPIEENLTISIFNSTGRLVKSYFHLSSPNYHADLSGIAPGVYFLEISNFKGRYYKMVIH